MQRGNSKLMKKYKVLLSGKNTIVMDDFFQYTNDVFTVVTTSMRNYDILNHLDFFKPDVFIYCLNGDKREDLLRLTEYRSKFERDDIIFIIVGSEDECDNFQRIAINMAKLVLQKHISATVLQGLRPNYPLSHYLQVLPPLHLFLSLHQTVLKSTVYFPPRCSKALLLKVS